MQLLNGTIEALIYDQAVSRRKRKIQACISSPRLDSNCVQYEYFRRNISTLYCISMLDAPKAFDQVE